MMPGGQFKITICDVKFFIVIAKSGAAEILIFMHNYVFEIT